MAGRGGYQQQFDGQSNVYPPYANNQYNASYDSFAPNNPFSDRTGAGNAGGYDKYGASTDTLAAGGPGAAAGNYATNGAKKQHSAWMEGGKEPAGSSSWKKWTLIGGLVVLVVAGVGGGIAGWKISQNNNSTSSRSSSSTGGTPNPETDSTVGPDPSVFVKDDRLKQSFYGIAYTPQNVQLPSCGATQDSVTQEIQIISQLTTRIRTYGSDCNQSAMVVQAIRDTKVDLSVWLGIYVDNNDTTWQRGVDDTINVLNTYGTANIGGITVGNEYILAQNATRASYAFIEDKVTEFKRELTALNLDKTIPVGTADAGSVMTSGMSTYMDYMMSNVHPWFGGLPIEQAAGWTWEFFENNDVAVAGTATPYIAEVGWPTNAMTRSALTYQGAVASVANLQIFLDTYVCQANANQTRYFYFEVFDEPWKEIYGGVEPYWGLFGADRVMKDVIIPDCVPTYD